MYITFGDFNDLRLALETKKSMAGILDPKSTWRFFYPSVYLYNSIHYRVESTVSATQKWQTRKWKSQGGYGKRPPWINLDAVWIMPSGLCELQFRNSTRRHDPPTSHIAVSVKNRRRGSVSIFRSVAKSWLIHRISSQQRRPRLNGERSGRRINLSNPRIDGEQDWAWFLLHNFAVLRPTGRRPFKSTAKRRNATTAEGRTKGRKFLLWGTGIEDKIGFLRLSRLILFRVSASRDEFRVTRRIHERLNFVENSHATNVTKRASVARVIV